MALWFILQAVAGKSWQQFWFKHHQATNHALHLLGFVDFLGHGAQVTKNILATACTLELLSKRFMRSAVATQPVGLSWFLHLLASARSYVESPVNSPHLTI